VGGNEGGKCLYNTRLDTYGCGCQHDCKYCYAKSLLSFRHLWNAPEPRIADIQKIERTIKRIPKGTVVRMGGMSDCFQPLEKKERVALETVKLLNQYGISYLIVTKSHLVAEREYLAALDKNLAHIQITVTCLDDQTARGYENASPSRLRLKAVSELQDAGFDVALRLSPFMEEYIDFRRLNAVSVNKCLVEFLRADSRIMRWFPAIDYSKYTLSRSNYRHLPLEEKLRVLQKVELPNISVCEDVSEHYEYWKNHYNPNKRDCCNLR
jgi:DNA repair photolyase